jgi:hypothetical protein
MPKKLSDEVAPAVEKRIIQFENDENDENFSENSNEKPIFDAEISNETFHNKNENEEINKLPGDDEEILQDDFQDFLENLPNDAEASFIIQRLPDRNLKGEFRQPCNVQKHIDTIYYNGESKPEEIYNQITEKFGGGKYHFQVRQGKYFGKGWTKNLSDPPFLTQIEKELKQISAADHAGEQTANLQNPPNPQPSTQTGETLDETDKMILFFEKHKKLNELLSPKSEQLQPVMQPAPAPNANVRENIKLLLIEKALTTGKPDLIEMTIRSAFDIPHDDQTDKPQGFWEIIANAFISNEQIQNKFGDIIAGTIEGGSLLIGNLMQAKTPAQVQTPNFSLAAFQQPRNNDLPVESDKTQPQTQETTENDVTAAAETPVLNIIHSIRLED